jgi:hypothetical protein
LSLKNDTHSAAQFLKDRYLSMKKHVILRGFPFGIRITDRIIPRHSTTLIQTRHQNLVGPQKPYKIRHQYRKIKAIRKYYDGSIKASFCWVSKFDDIIKIRPRVIYQWCEGFVFANIQDFCCAILNGHQKFQFFMDEWLQVGQNLRAEVVKTEKKNISILTKLDDVSVRCSQRFDS